MPPYAVSEKRENCRFGFSVFPWYVTTRVPEVAARWCGRAGQKATLETAAAEPPSRRRSGFPSRRHQRPSASGRPPRPGSGATASGA